MREWTQQEQQAVAKVIVSRWPGGIRNQGWQLDAHLETLEAFLSEMQFDNLTPKWAIVGLRACDSAFLPSAGQVRKLARDARPPLTAADIADAEQRMVQRDRETRRLEAGPS